MSSQVIEFCKCREHLNRVQRETQDVRVETADAIRTLSGLLVDTMERTNTSCIRVPRTQASALYVRRIPPQMRAKQLRTMDDVVAILADISRDVVEVPWEDVPDAIVKIVRQRVREQGTQKQATIRVVERVGPRENITEMDHAGREAQTLTRQFVESYVERQTVRAQIKPLKDAFRRAEKTLKECTSSFEQQSDESTAPRATTDARLGDTPRENEQRSVGMEADVSPSPVKCDDTMDTRANPTPGNEVALVSMKRQDNRTSYLQIHRHRTAARRRHAFGLMRVCASVRKVVSEITERGPDFEKQLCEGVREDLLGMETTERDEMETRIVVRRIAERTLRAHGSVHNTERVTQSVAHQPTAPSTQGSMRDP